MSRRTNRVLIVIGDQWQDPTSTVIDRRYVKREGMEFQHICALLKVWGIPFDVLRLDQQNLNLSYLLDGHGDPIYGCIIWDADQPSEELPLRNVLRKDVWERIKQDYASLLKIVKEKGTGLIGIGEHIKERTIESLLGLKYAGTSIKRGKITIEKDHFITRGILGKVFEKQDQDLDGESADVIVEKAQVLVTQDGNPIVTCSEKNSSSKVAWIGGHSPSIFSNYTEMQHILRRCIVWSTGFSLYRNYDKTLILTMDDLGSIKKKPTKEEWKRAKAAGQLGDDRFLGFLRKWRFPAFTKEEIKQFFIDPLKDRNAILNLYVVTGLYSPPTPHSPPLTVDYGHVVSPWILRENYDEKRVNDMVSTLEGIRKGLEDKVFETHDHGWTHHGYGPWRRLGIAPEPEEERSDLPIINRLFQLRMSKQAIEFYFGVTPLAAMIFPGNSLENHTGRAACRAGIRFVANRFYTGIPFTIDLKGIVDATFVRIPEGFLPYRSLTDLRRDEFEKTSTAPKIIGFHDRDVGYDNDFIRKLLDIVGDNATYLGLNEFIAYLSSQVSGALGNELNLNLEYEEHSCRYLENNTSNWTLHLSDDAIARLERQGKTTLKIDGEIKKEISQLTEIIDIEIPKGLGTHTIRIE